MKERALARLKQPEFKHARYRPPKALLDFLRVRADSNLTHRADSNLTRDREPVIG